MEDKALKKMRVVVLDREKRAQKILKQEAGWDGKFPIPVTFAGGCKLTELDEDFNLIHASGDDQCCWLGDAVSAAILYLRGHDLIKDKSVLAKRKTFAY